ncbi:hypothetical protein [Thermococcus sp. 2319x1]|uniref:hypothetical protein n=1 Tax=Thermococcus sp. 2319x1 TaxID=1674923 RepID=UPI0015824DF1|nr:hypothetical protein [Thermococcus sp. 2319x1]
MCKCMWKVGLVLFLLSLSFLPFVSATRSLCGPNPVLAPTEYCSFYPFIKAGEDDAIITLSWDALGPGMQGVPTPSMVGEYYFYFKDGRIYYLGNTIGGDELRYVFHNGLWYISNGMVINPEGPCIRRAMKLPSQIVSAMRSENYSISSNDYPAYINGSKIYTSNGSVSYVIEIPGNLSINIPDNVTLSSVFLRGGVLLFFRPENPFVPFGWENLTVLYYDGSFLWRLNFTKGIENSLPTCQEESLKFYGVLLTGIILVLVLVYWKAKMG